MAVIESLNLSGLALSHSVDKAPLDDDFVRDEYRDEED